jgi:hypothetical protein
MKCEYQELTRLRLRALWNPGAARLGGTGLAWSGQRGSKQSGAGAAIAARNNHDPKMDSAEIAHGQLDLRLRPVAGEINTLNLCQ